MTNLARGSVLITAIMLTACSGKEPEPGQKAEHKALFNNVSAPMEKAKGVEQQLEKSAEEQKKQIDRQMDQ